jgi:hypothetical protein
VKFAALFFKSLIFIAFTGLLYYKNPNSERSHIAADTILISVSSTSDSDTVLAAARLPMQKIRLPLRFVMTSANSVSPAQTAAWKQALATTDLLVTAVVCRTIGGKNSLSPVSCSTAPNGLEAAGVAKFLRLQNGALLRAPVSLSLE